MRWGICISALVCLLSATARADGDAAQKDPLAPGASTPAPAATPARAAPPVAAVPAIVATASAPIDPKPRTHRSHHARSHWRDVPASSGDLALGAPLPPGEARYTAAQALAPIWAGFTVGADTGLDVGSSGPVGVGLRGGYDMQSNDGVVGVRVSANFGNGGASQNASWTGDPQGATSYQASGSGASHFIGTVAGRLGWAMGGAMLPYIEGGLALANVSTSSSLAAQGPTFGSVDGLDSGSAWQVGGVIGVGLEYMIVPGWSLDVELRDILIANTTRTASVVDAKGFVAKSPFAYGVGGAQLLVGANARF